MISLYLITGDVNRGLLVERVSDMFLHYKVTFVINEYLMGKYCETSLLC